MLFHPLTPPIMFLGQLISWGFFNSRLEKAPKYFVIALFILFNLAAIPSLYFMYYSDSPPTHSTFLWNYVFRPAFLWEAIHLIWLPLALALTILASLLRLLTNRKAKGFHSLFKDKSSKRKLMDLRVIILVAMLALAAFGYNRQLQPPKITELEIIVPELSPALYGYKIALVSDLHYGRGTNLNELTSVLAQIATLRPNLVILAGDLVDRHASFGLDYGLPVKTLREVPNGVFAVLGNHDKKVDSVGQLIDNLEQVSLQVLQNQSANIPDKPVTLIGFDDSGKEDLTYHSDRGKLLFPFLTGPGPREGDLVIVINHRPEGISDAVASGATLFLAGHTHGGQVQAPWNPQLNIASLIFGYPYSTGAYKISNMTLFVTNGVASGYQARLFAWPEIAVVTLAN